MASLRISVWAFLLAVIVATHCAPFGGSHHHTHTIIHVPTRVHTVHHHHVKKVPVYIHHKHTHHHEVHEHHHPGHDHGDEDIGGEEYEEDHLNSWHSRNDDEDSFDHFDNDHELETDPDHEFDYDFDHHL